MYPYKHTHVAVVCAFGYGKGYLVGSAAMYFDGISYTSPSGDVFRAEEVVLAIAVIVDGYAEACGSGRVEFVKVVGNLDGKGVLSATEDI